MKYTETQLDYLDQLESEYKKAQKTMNIHELIEVYKPTKTMLTNVKRDLYDRLDKVRDLRKEIENRVENQNIPYSEAETLKMILIGIYVTPDETDIKKQIDRAEKILKNIEFNKSLGKGNNEKLNIEEAKTVPIDTYIEFNRMGFAKCIYHSENTASMKYYKDKNRVHCFGCGQGGDVIDVVQKLRGVEFLDAVRIILNK